MPVYLDNAATTKPCDACAEAMLAAMRDTYGNPSSLHTMGLDAEKTVDAARRQIASALHCEPSALTFTSGATESNHLALRGAAAAYGKRKKRIVASSIEHACVRGALEQLEADGFEVVRIAPQPDGSFDAAAFAAAADENTCLVTMMLVNNELGAVLPVQQAFSAVKRRFPEIITHTDAVQGFLKIPFSPESLCADLLTVSGHKVHACKGIGALYHKKGIRLKPLLTGGEQEGGLRAGTESVPLIAGFGAAAAFLAPTLTERAETVRALRTAAIGQLTSLGGVTVQSPEDGSPYILSISLQGLRSETVLHFLAERGIYVSSGSACSKGRQSGVLQAFGIRQEAADSTLRVSFSAENTEEDVTALTEGIAAAQARLVRRK